MYVFIRKCGSPLCQFYWLYKSIKHASAAAVIQRQQKIYLIFTEKNMSNIYRLNLIGPLTVHPLNVEYLISNRNILTLFLFSSGPSNGCFKACMSVSVFVGLAASIVNLRSSSGSSIPCLFSSGRASMAEDCLIIMSNCSLLSVATFGSVGVMLGCSPWRSFSSSSDEEVT